MEYRFMPWGIPFDSLTRASRIDGRKPLTLRRNAAVVEIEDRPRGAPHSKAAGVTVSRFHRCHHPAPLSIAKPHLGRRHRALGQQVDAFRSSLGLKATSKEKSNPQTSLLYWR
jgi:hypothetical protein